MLHCLKLDDLHSIIQGCIALERQSQKAFYARFYGFAAAICMRYANNEEDTIEMVNDGFLKIFKELHAFKPVFSNEEVSLKGWMKRIMVNTAIDHYRKYYKRQLLIDAREDKAISVAQHGESSIDKLSYEELLKVVQQLSPGYRAVFNLYVIDGLSHEEISAELGISVGTSKSNLAKARVNLQKMLQSMNRIAV
ncbi:MAG: sigma-70 family RNA polymerase sigma factor [Bacteroidota bacterium]|nr:sigma-70 family RNA polymerase sigma factor [Bacteroidota bacterium]